MPGEALYVLFGLWAIAVSVVFVRADEFLLDCDSKLRKDEVERLKL
jgi:hypothetical protein